MALIKQSRSLNFSEGVDTKSDPFQVQAGKFLSLQNTVFTKAGLLAKRNGYGQLPSLPDATSAYVTTFNGALTAIGNNLKSYSSASMSWVNNGNIQPVSLSVLPIIRSTTNQSQADSVTSASGLTCTVFTDQSPSSLSTPIYCYAVTDSTTGQRIIAQTTIALADATLGTPRVFLLGNYFVIVFTNKVSSTYHLKYFTINVNTQTVSSPTDVSASYTATATVAFDGVVFNDLLYIAWNSASAGGIKMATLTPQLSLSSVVNPDASHFGTMVSVCADASTSTVWVSYFDVSTHNGYSFGVNSALTTTVSVGQIISSKVALNITSSAQNGTCTVFYEVSNNYSYDSAIASHFIDSVPRVFAGTVGSTTTPIRSVGLASKSFIVNGTIYFLTAYQSPYQPTYFLTDSLGNLIAKLAYGNGGGYLINGLPNVTVTGNLAQVPYVIKDLISAVNKDTNVSAGTQVNGIYSQLGINVASFTLGGQVVSSEIGNNLNLTGGFLWAYDGVAPVEHNFLLWPDSIETTHSGSGGLLTAQPYFYQVTYEWSDNQGNVHRSAPSIPVTVTTTGTTSSVTITGPTLRLTYKTNAKIVIYRWSAGQPVYFQVTSLSVPVLNSTTADSFSFVDTLADSAILGNNILYTNGGVVEDIGPPSFSSIDLFDDRLWGISSEDPNTLWYSKQVIENTPVEMSDLFTFYVAPTISAQGSTGPNKCLAALDDKQIVFKGNAIYYFNGTGPDNTGANSQYSQPIFITSTVGCSNQASIVFIPDGLMFQSDKGIWLLGRDLSTSYIGAPVESFNSFTVQSAVNVPGTNQVRFTLSNGTTLMYDYFYKQWGTFVGVPAISSTLYQGLHTYINGSGQVFQESPGSYLDGSSPVLMSFTTAWMNLAGLQGYQRAYNFMLLGTYLSPHKLAGQIAYDYAPAATQSFQILPPNYAGPYGSDSPYGTSIYGGIGQLEQWQIELQTQKCQAFQITINEIFDSSFGTTAGAGLTLSGLNIVYGVKSGYAKIPPTRSTG